MFIDFESKRYYLDRSTGYYREHMRSVDRDYLHRAVWRAAHGNIPHGWEVHHKVEDKGATNADDLECLPALEHNGRHAERSAGIARRTIAATRVRRAFVCEGCGREYQGIYRKVRRWCSKACSNAFHNRRAA